MRLRTLGGLRLEGADFPKGLKELSGLALETEESSWLERITRLDITSR